MYGDSPRGKDDFIMFHTYSCFHHYFGVMDIGELSCELSTFSAIRYHI